MMNWMKYLWDFFPPCEQCKKNQTETLEMLRLIEDLVKTQSEMLQYMKKIKSK